MVRPDTLREIARQNLNTLEDDLDIFVPFAVESGSRTWGFASEDSDLDIRGIFIRPVSQYLTLDTPKDTIEKMDNNFAFPTSDGAVDFFKIDIALWDAFKALRLLRKLNPQIIEWLFNEAPYCDETMSVLVRLRSIIRDKHLRSTPFGMHYVGMARENYHQYIANPVHAKEPVKLKKYLYAVRPLLMLYYIEEYNQYPPFSMDELLLLAPEKSLPGRVRYRVQDILDAKRNGTELGTGPNTPVIDEWIQGAIIDLRKNYADTRADNTVELGIACESALQNLLSLSRRYNGRD